MEGNPNLAAAIPGLRAAEEPPPLSPHPAGWGGVSDSLHPLGPLPAPLPGAYSEVQVVSPGADDLVFSRAVAQLVLVDVVAPRRISVLIEGHRVPRNAWGTGAVGVLHSVSLLEPLPKG